MNPLKELFARHGQSPWLDNIRRDWIAGGELQTWVKRGVRGLTSNPTIFQKAIEGTSAYDAEFREATSEGLNVEESYWQLVTSDICAALGILRPVHDQSNGVDGYVSVEIDPGLAHRCDDTTRAARELHHRLDAPNLFVKIPATTEGLLPIETLISEKLSINVTLIFSLNRYREVIEAYLAGLEAAKGDLSTVSSVASFFISRVDAEVDRRLNAVGIPRALAMRGKAGIANGRLAYATFVDAFSGPRWEALAARGARVQRPLWASTSTKNPAYPDTMYVDQLIGPHTINTLPDATLEAFEDHGTLARTIDADIDHAQRVIKDLGELGINMHDVTQQLEKEGVAAFAKSFEGLLSVLATKADALRRSTTR